MLEQLLLLSGTKASTKADWLAEPYIRLLRALCSWRHLNKNNWIDQGLVKEYTKRSLPPPFHSDALVNGVLDLDTHQRIRILGDLCEWLLRSSDTLRSLVPDYGAELRLEAMSDKAVGGLIYYVMEDARLYSYHSSTSTKSDDFWNSTWTAVAVNNEQYEAFFNDLQSRIASWKGKQKKDGQELLDSIQTEYNEWIQEALREQERRMRRSVRSVRRMRDASSPLKLREGGIYSSYYPEGVTKRSGRLAEKEARVQSEREAMAMEEKQREAERLSSLREQQSQRMHITSDNAGDVSMSDRERRRLLRTEKRIIEEAKEVEIAAIEAKYLNHRVEGSNVHSDEEIPDNVSVGKEMNHERSPKIRIVFKAKSVEKTEDVVERASEPGRIDGIKDVGVLLSTQSNTLPSQNALDSTHQSHPILPIPREGNHEKPSTPQMIGDAKLLAEFAAELQHPAAPEDEGKERSGHFDVGQSKAAGT